MDGRILENPSGRSPGPARRSVAGDAVGVWRDWLGIAASVACAIHCAAMPLVIGALPLLGLECSADPAFHQWMVAVCATLAAAAFIPGWRRHRSHAPGVIAVAGLALISIAAFAIPGDCCPADAAGSAGAVVAAGTADEVCARESCCPVEDDAAVAADVVGHAGPSFLPVVHGWLTPLGSFALIAAHLLNRRCAGRCGD